MSDHVTNYIASDDKLRKALNVKENYPIRVVLDKKWDIIENNGLRFLSFESGVTHVIVGQKRAQAAQRYAKYSCVIAIDCVKIAFVLLTGNRMVS